LECSIYRVGRDVRLAERALDLFAGKDNPDFVDWIYAVIDELEFGHFTRINAKIGSDATRDFALFAEGLPQ
jgi:hypothetical protein